MIADATRSLSFDYYLLLEYHVAWHLSDTEIVYTYEGTDTMQSLTAGRDVTGISAFA